MTEIALDAITTDWTRWFAAACPDRPARWRLIRFGTADAQGAPIEATTPEGERYTFPSERQAALAARSLNAQEGR